MQPAKRSRVEKEVQANETTEDLNQTRNELDRVTKTLARNKKKRYVEEDLRGLKHQTKG